MPRAESSPARDLYLSTHPVFPPTLTGVFHFEYHLLMFLPIEIRLDLSGSGLSFPMLVPITVPGARSCMLSEHSILVAALEGDRSAGVGGISRVAGSQPSVDASQPFPGHGLWRAN